MFPHFEWVRFKIPTFVAWIQAGSKFERSSYFFQGFLTKSGLVNPSRVQMIMQELGKMEDAIFKERQSREIRFKQMNKSKRRMERSDNGPAWTPGGQFAPHVSQGEIKCKILKYPFLELVAITVTI